MKLTRFNLICAIGMFLWLPFFGLEELLVGTHVLNTKDLKHVAGNETGTVVDYLLNAWVWDGVCLVLMVLAAVCFFILLSSWCIQSLNKPSEN